MPLLSDHWARESLKNKLLFVSLVESKPKPFLGIAKSANPRPNLSCVSINSLLFIIIKSR